MITGVHPDRNSDGNSKKSIPDENELFDLAELFKVFGDSTRIRILYALYDEDPDIEDSGIILKAIANRCYHRIKDWDNAMAVSLRDEESLEMMHIVMNGELQIVAGGDVLKGGMYDYNVQAIPKIMLLEQTPKEAFDAISKSVQVQMDKYYSN